MGRVGGNSVNDKPNHNQQPEVASNQPTSLEPSSQATQPHLDEPFDVEVQEPPEQEQQQQPAQQHIIIQPQFNIQPQINIQQPHIQPQPPPPHVNGYPTHYPQPPQQQVVFPPQPSEWTTGLFDCIDNPENAIITLFCPCVTFGQIASGIDNGRTSCESAGCIYTGIALCIALPCIYSCTYRTKLRHRFGLPEEPASDCITHLCCEYCALCQEYRELNNRGSNPSAEWMNTNSQQGMVAPAYQTMR